MKKDFTPIKIGFNEGERAKFETDLINIKNLLNDFFSECEKYIEIKDKNKYKGSLFNSFVNDFSNKYKSKFPEILTIDKILELSNVNTDKLKFLSSKIQELKLNIDYNSLEMETPDFCIYTSNLEENLLFQYAQGISKAIHENKPSHLSFFNADLQRGFTGLLLYDFSTQKLIPNIGFIKGQFKRI
jgi:hypothetical protein